MYADDSSQYSSHARVPFNQPLDPEVSPGHLGNAFWNLLGAADIPVGTPTPQGIQIATDLAADSVPFSGVTKLPAVLLTGQESPRSFCFYLFDRPARFRRG